MTNAAETITDLTPYLNQSVRIIRTVFGRRWDMGVCHILKAWDGGCMVREEDGTVSAMATRLEEQVEVRHRPINDICRDIELATLEGRQGRLFDLGREYAAAMEVQA